MRKIIVKHFVGYTKFKSSVTREIAKMFFIPVVIAVIILTNNYTISAIFGIIGFVLYITNKPPKIFSRLRASQIVYPVMYIYAIIYAYTRPDENGWYWYHFVMSAIVILCLWIGFQGYGIGYFDLFKVKREELDAEQLQDYDKDKDVLNLKKV